MSLFDKCQSFTRAEELKEVQIYPYFSPLASGQETEILLNGKRLLMLGSNSYLGLTTHPKVIEAAKKAVDQYGSSCAGSRFLNGTLELHEELERRLAAFAGKEKAIVFTTGFQANLGTIATLVGKDDIVITDKTDHASIIDGARLSFGRMYRFNHNNIEDLERVLENCNGNGNGKLIVIDGVFSMDGDIADLPGITAAAEKYGVGIMVDDAHGLGVLGPNGDGTAAHFGLNDKIDLIMGTFSKSFASIGGFVAGQEQVIEYIRHYARSLIFSASLPPAQVAAALTSLDIIEGEPERREALWTNTRFLKSGLGELGFNTGLSETPIIPVIVGDDLLCFQMWRELQTEGIFVNPIISPAVPPDQALMRVSIMATHTREQLEQALDIFKKVGKRLNII
ncbi:MAG: aminotransferase class I/II-fold pyridoxal phosphate-dependent enzyme [Planctomycetota bacterium]|jgi:8-amino-7-oxononanoate synthase